MSNYAVSGARRRQIVTDVLKRIDTMASVAIVTNHEYAKWLDRIADDIRAANPWLDPRPHARQQNKLTRTRP
jgi:hypothetical protein